MALSLLHIEFSSPLRSTSTMGSHDKSTHRGAFFVAHVLGFERVSPVDCDRPPLVRANLAIVFRIANLDHY